MADPPGNAEAPSEERDHRVEPSDREHVADTGAADPVSLDPVRVAAMDVESVGRSGCAKELDVPLRLVTEAEVVADDKMANPELGVQQVVDERAGRHRGELLVEPHAEHPVDRGSPQGLHLLAEPGDPGRGDEVVEHLLRMRLEHHEHRGQAEVLSERREPLEQCPVTDVDAVEDPDGEHAAAVAGTEVVQAADELQDGFAPLRPFRVRLPGRSLAPRVAFGRLPAKRAGRPEIVGDAGRLYGRRRGRRPPAAAGPGGGPRSPQARRTT